MSAIGVNEIHIIGNVGADPDFRYVPSGKAVANFNVCVNDPYDSANPNWFNVVVWEKLAENATKYLTKGSKVYIRGSIKFSTYPNKDTGQIINLKHLLLSELPLADI